MSDYEKDKYKQKVLEDKAEKEKRKLSAVIELAVDEYWSAQNGRRHVEIG